MEFEKRDITQSTKNLYISNLTRLNDGVLPKNNKFLKDKEKITAKINEYSPNTQRTYYIAIVSYLPDKNKDKKYYYDKMMELNERLRDNTEISEKQKENWISWEEVMKVYDDLKNASKLLKKNDKTLIEKEELLKFIILSLYVLQPPRRIIDYTLMEIVPQYNGDMDNSKNYLSLDDKKFYFNNYKTKGTYKQQVQNIPSELFKILKKYKTSGNLLERNDKPLSSSNITKLMNRIFGKNISVSMLRNIYLTENHSEAKEKLINDVKMMGTSVNCANSNYIKRS